MFTIYHAVLLVAAFIIGMILGHSIGEADGRESVWRDIQEENEMKRRRSMNRREAELNQREARQ